MRAVCTNPKHKHGDGRQCQMERTCLGNRSGSVLPHMLSRERPLGLLGNWLLQSRCENVQSLFEHSEVDATDVEDRANARKFVCEDIEGGLAFAEECEREQRLGEDVEPPAIR